MNSKERFLAALSGKVPDRVPVTPDFSNMIPAKRTGLPFWDIYFFDGCPLWEAYLETADYFGIELWNVSGWWNRFLYADQSVEYSITHKFDRAKDAMVRQTVMHTRLGDLSQEEICFRFDPPTLRHKYLKEPLRDWPLFRESLTLPTALDRPDIEKNRQECHQRQQAFGLAYGFPGFHSWFSSVEAGVETLSYLSMDNPEILEEWFEFDLAIGTRSVQLLLAEKPDYLFFGGSGTITLASPDLARRYALPALKKWTAMAKAAGVPTLIHSCGKSRVLVDMLVEETDMNCINPLEVAPMGDVDLAEVKRSRGRSIALMGNLHTTDLMLRGTPEQVYQASVAAMDAAADGGGFILSTGDQCPRDTPEANIFAMVAAAKEHGVYDRETGLLVRPRRQ